MKFKRLEFWPDKASMTPHHSSGIGHRMALTVHHQAVIVSIPRSLWSHLSFTEVASIGSLLLYSSHGSPKQYQPRWEFQPGPRQQEASQIKKEEVPVAVLEDIGIYWSNCDLTLSTTIIHYYPLLSCIILYSWSEQTKNPPNPKHEAMGITSVLCWRQQVSNEPPERDKDAPNAICAFLIDSNCDMYMTCIYHIDPYWSILIRIGYC